MGPVQLKSILFKVQLYFHTCLVGYVYNIIYTDRDLYPHLPYEEIKTQVKEIKT